MTDAQVEAAWANVGLRPDDKTPPLSASEPAGAPSEGDVAQVIADGLRFGSIADAARAVLALLRWGGKE